MADFTLSVAAVKSAFDTFRTAQATTAAAQLALTELGAAPAKPTTVVADADWNNYVASLDTYNASYATDSAAVFAAQATQRTAELAVIAAMGYNTGDTITSLCLNQWVHVVGSGSGVLTYSLYIGAGVNSTYLTILSSAPTQPYPNY